MHGRSVGHRLILSPGKGNLCLTDVLVATAIEAAGGEKLWNTLRGI
jgi:hypothetical protein